MFILVPFTFQGVLGLEGMLATPIVDGSGVAEAMGNMVGGGGFVDIHLVMLMILALMLCHHDRNGRLVAHALPGLGRRLAAEVSQPRQRPRRADPRHVDRPGVQPGPARHRRADATSYFFILAVSNCCYIIFNFLNLNSGWIHRIDNGHVARPYKAPTILLVLGDVFAFVNAVFMGAGAKVWNPMALWAGLIAAALIIPVFFFRHYIQDKGEFPAHMLADLERHDGAI